MDERRAGDRFIPVLWSAINKHARAVVLEIVVAPHMDIAVGVSQRKRRAAEVWNLDTHGEHRKRLVQNSVDHRLIIGNAVIYDVVKAVIVFYIHSVKVVPVVITGQLLYAASCLKTGKIHARKHKYASE